MVGDLPVISRSVALIVVLVFVVQVDSATVSQPGHLPVFATRSQFLASGLQLPSTGSNFLLPAFRSPLPVPQLQFSAPDFSLLVPHAANYDSIFEDPPTPPPPGGPPDVWQNAFRNMLDDQTMSRNMIKMAYTGFNGYGRGAIFANYKEDTKKVDVQYMPLTNIKQSAQSPPNEIERGLISQIEAYTPETQFIVVFIAFGTTGGQMVSPGRNLSEIYEALVRLDQMNNQLEQAGAPTITPAPNTVADGNPSLLALKLRDNHVKYLFTGLFALASFTLALICFMKLRSFQKIGMGLQDSLMHA